MTTREWGFIIGTLATTLAVVLALTRQAPADEQRRFWDARGNSAGTASTDSQGNTTFRDARGNVIGKASGGTHGDRRQGNGR
jgi:hypothetical protein